MSHYNKWAGGGYYYSDWWKKKDKKKKGEKEEDKKSSSPSASSSSSLPSTTTTPYRSGGYSGGYSSYDYYDDDYYDDDVVNYKDIYRSRYKSSLGYSSGKLSSSTIWWSGYEGSYGSYGGWKGYSGCAGMKSGDEFEQLKTFLIKAVKEARDLIVILDFPYKIKICFDNSSPILHKDQRRIFVSTSMLSDTSKSDEEKLGIFCGLAVHEASHLKFTTLRVIDKYIKDILSKGTLHSAEQQLVKSLIMMIEDERVEDSLLKERPGYIEFIEKEKTYEYTNFINSVSCKNKYAQFFLNLYKLIRFPENVDLDILNKYTDIYEEIGNIITPLPESSKEVCTASYKVYEAIKNGFKVDEMDEEEKKKFFDAMKSVGKSAENGFETLLYGEDGDDLSLPNITKIDPSIRDKTTGTVLSDLTEGDAFNGEFKDTFFSKAENNFEVYKQSLDRVKKYIPTIRKLIRGHDKNFEFNIYGCRSGLLDTNKLAEAYQGVPQVYVRRGKVTTNKTTVCVLIDESGSMGWTKMNTARDTAILLNESLKDIPGVDLYVYGHTGDCLYTGSTEIKIYKEGNEKDIPPYALGSADSKYENRDGVAIYEVAKRVRKLTQDPVLMFIISDGVPSAVEYRGRPAREDTAKNVKLVEKMGFSTVAVTIDDYYEATEMYPRNIDLSDNLEEFPKKLGRIIKDLIIKDKKTTVE
jgi:nitric oxide reductase activation protein